jgi:hypothetical protein
MSIEGISNYEHMKARSVRPEWELLERIDYCDQDTEKTSGSFVDKLVSFFRQIF